MLAACTRIIPISDPNKVKTIKKLKCGSLEVTFNSGAVSVLSEEDELFQQFVVYAVLADL